MLWTALALLETLHLLRFWLLTAVVFAIGYLLAWAVS